MIDVRIGWTDRPGGPQIHEISCNMNSYIKSMTSLKFISPNSNGSCLSMPRLSDRCKVSLLVFLDLTVVLKQESYKSKFTTQLSYLQTLVPSLFGRNNLVYHPSMYITFRIYSFGYTAWVVDRHPILCHIRCNLKMIKLKCCFYQVLTVVILGARTYHTENYIIFTYCGLVLLKFII